MATKKKVHALVLSQEEIAPDIYSLWLETDLASEARPGQFIGLYPKGADKLLPRPISICEAEPDKLRLVYRVAGGGTREFASLLPGESVTFLGMLGNGYPLDAAAGKRVLLLGGGIGIPPLVQLAAVLSGKQPIGGKSDTRVTFENAPIAGEVVVVAGYRDHHLFLTKELERCGTLHIATEDGSLGTRGNVLDVNREKELSADIVMACGPMPMLRAVKKWALEQDIPAYISLEERMACGVGACLGCVCTTVREDAHSHVHNARICTEGPVFEAREVEIG